MKKILTMTIAGILLFGTAAFALTLDEAKKNIDTQATEKKLSAREHSQATTVLQGLVDKGVPVEHAYRVVDASINQGIKGNNLAEVANAVGNVGPAARQHAATVVSDAIRHRYTVRETVQLTNTFGKTVAAGAPADRASQVMSEGINKGVGTAEITGAMNTYAEQIRSGTPAERAADNATRTMDRDRDRTMQQDRDMTRDRDHMGSGSGRDHGGMGNGAGMGSGAVPGMGGPRR